MKPKSILIVSNICPFPPRTGISVRIANLLEWLRGEGYEITYVLQPIDVESKRDLRDLKAKVASLIVVQEHSATQRVQRATRKAIGRLLSLVAPTIYDQVRSKPPSSAGQKQVSVDANELGKAQYGDLEAPCLAATVKVVQKIAFKIRPSFALSVGGSFSRCLEAVPRETVRLLDANELYSQSHNHFDSVQLYTGFRCTEESERRALSRADILIAIQRNDKKKLEDWFPNKKVVVTPCTLKEAPTSLPCITRATNRILYVGSAHHFNLHGMKRFLTEVWPEMLRHKPDLNLRIVGDFSKFPDVSGSGVVLLGRVNDVTLIQEYRAATMAINPQLAGTGLKIKCVEALGLGCPLVSYEAGADGIEDGHLDALLMAKTKEEFTDYMLQLLSDAELRRKLEVGSVAYAQTHFSKQAAFRDLRLALDQFSLAKGL
jgi:glycosyltransferase involved in cell wall biosynthesis